MTRLLIATVLLSSFILSGCGSMLAAVKANPIEDEPVKRTLGQKLEDESIETKAMVNIKVSDEGFANSHLEIVSYNGFVLLAGQVPTAALKNQAAEVVRKIHGVRRIYNELEVSAPSSAMTRTSDTWITAKVKSWILGTPSTPGMRIKVLTENGVVYLMGLATAAEGQRVTDVAANISGVQRVVRLFEIVPG